MALPDFPWVPLADKLWRDRQGVALEPHSGWEAPPEGWRETTGGFPTRRKGNPLPSPYPCQSRKSPIFGNVMVSPGVMQLCMEHGAALTFMSDTARKTVVSAYQQRKQEEVTHPLLEQKMTVGMLPFAQARLLAR